MWESQGIMLTAEELVRRRTKTDFVLPQRGPKCFTPSGSWLESKQLRTLLDATKDLIAEERVERESALAQAEWDENIKVAKVTRVVGRQFEKFGHEDNMTIFLHPEEALYLLETNHLQLMYGGVSMSIQQAYSVLLGPKTGCTFIEYLIFSHLLKNGFKVLRHSPKRTVTRYERLIGLHQQHPKSRKSRRKSSAPLRYSSYGSNEKNGKSVEKVETENEKHSVGSYSVQPVETDSKSGKSAICTGVAEDSVVDMNSSNPFEAAVVSNFSSGSDIEILSEKSVSKSEESLEYDITEYSSSSTSEDSDCQVIFSGDADSNSRSKKKVIEEVNLDDSSESEVDRCNIENSSHIKSENVDEVIIHDGAQSIEYKTLQDEPNLNSDFNNECHPNENIQAGSLNLEANEASVVELKNSSDLAEQNHGNQRVLGVQSFEENEVTSSIGQEVFVQENSEEISMCVPILISMKEEEIKQESAPMLSPRVSVIQRNINVPLKKESDKIISGISQKEKEIEVIDLDDDEEDDEHDNDDNDNASNNVNNNTNNENYIVEDKNTILLMFPNCAGCHTIRCEVPPQHLCPPNVNPTLQIYNIVLDRLQDPEYGGNPRKINKKRFHDNYRRYQNSGYSQNNGPRFRCHPIKPFNRRGLNFSRENERYDRHNQWHEGPDVRRDESYRDPRMFRDHSPMGPYFRPMNVNQVHNEYANFSGHLPGRLSPYHHSRPNNRWRGNYSPRQYRSNSDHHYPYQNSRGHRLPRRKSRASYPDRNVAARNEYNSSEVMNERGEGYVSLNPDNSDNHSHDEQKRRSQVRKRHGRPVEENQNSGGSERKQSREMRHTGRYFSPATRSQDLLSFLDSIQGDNGGNSVTNLARDCNNSQENSSVTRGSLSTMADNENSESSESSVSESSYSSSGSSEESSDESMDESNGDGVGCTISALFKSNDVEDIDTSLKSLEIVHSVKFQEPTSLSHEPLLIIKFDLYQPYTPFRRSDPPIPDFRVVVMQPDQTLPTSRQLTFLGQGFDDDVPLLFAIASVDSVAFYLQSAVNLPLVSSKENV